jgi:hypothetical protein
MSNNTTNIPAPAVADNRADRLFQAKAEHKALAAWRNDGEQGDPPATPNLDAVNAEKKSGAKPMSTSKKAARPEAGSIRFWHNGRPLADIDNYISRLAYDDTRGLGEGGKTLTSQQLTDLLFAAGIESPTTTTWEFELPNGRWIGAALKGDDTPANVAVKRGRTVKAKAAKAEVVWTVERTGKRAFVVNRNGEAHKTCRSAAEAQRIVAEAGGPTVLDIDDMRVAS